MKTLDEMIAVMQAARDGKRIEWRRHSGGDWEQTAPVWNWNGCDYRIKPEQKLRPWKPEEVPVGGIVRKQGSSCKNLIISVEDDETLVITGAAWAFRTTPTQILLTGEHSTDGGKTWKPCGVEE